MYSSWVRPGLEVVTSYWGYSTVSGGFEGVGCSRRPLCSEDNLWRHKHVYTYTWSLSLSVCVCHRCLSGSCRSTAGVAYWAKHFQVGDWITPSLLVSVGRSYSSAYRPTIITSLIHTVLVWPDPEPNKTFSRRHSMNFTRLLKLVLLILIRFVSKPIKKINIHQFYTRSRIA